MKSTGMTDQELIEGILNHERTAFQYLVEKYQKKVIKTACYFIGNMDDAEDLAQEIFLEIIDSMRTFKRSSSLSTWIYRITVNKSLNALKRQNKKRLFIRIESLFRSSEGKEIAPVLEPYTSDASFETNEKRELLQKALNSLPENQRVALVLHKYDDLPYKEIAHIMNISLSSVESLIHRAKLNLQKRLIRHFPEYSNQ